MSLPKRNEVPTEQCWDPRHLFSNDQAFYVALEDQQKAVEAFKQRYNHKISAFTTADQIIELYTDLEKITQAFDCLSTYPALRSDVDRNDREAARLSQQAENILAQCHAQLSFVESALLTLDINLLEAVIQKDKRYRQTIRALLRQKAHQLEPETERVLKTLSPVLNAPERTYTLTRATDFHFPDIQMPEGPQANSFVGYENNLCSVENTNLRRKAFASFSKGLSQFKNTIGQNYFTQIQKEKILSELRGYPSVIEYLLDQQDVLPDLYHRQIDITMTELAPHMRRFAKCLQRMHRLEKMHYADLKLTLDAAYAPKIDIPEAKRMCLESLSILGSEYRDIIDQMLNNRRIDYAQNAGKSSGGYCASPYGHGSFILLNWNGNMDEVFTLAHELGHAGHFNLAMQYQNYFNTDCSMYQVEAPST